MQYQDYGGSSYYVDFDGRVEPGTYTAAVGSPSCSYTIDDIVYSFDPVESTASADMASVEVTSTTYYVPENPVAITRYTVVSPRIGISQFSQIGAQPMYTTSFPDNLVLFDPAIAGFSSSAVIDASWGGGEVFGGAYQDNTQYGPWNAFDFNTDRFQTGQWGLSARAAENIHMFNTDASDTEMNVLGFISPFPRVVTSLTVGSIDPGSPDNIVPNNYQYTSRNFKLQGSNDTDNGITGTWVDIQEFALGVWAIGGVWGDQTFTIWLPGTNFSQVNNVAYKAHRLVPTDGAQLCFAKTLFFGYY